MADETSSLEKLVQISTDLNAALSAPEVQEALQSDHQVFVECAKMFHRLHSALHSNTSTEQIRGEVTGEIYELVGFVYSTSKGHSELQLQHTPDDDCTSFPSPALHEVIKTINGELALGCDLLGERNVGVTISNPLTSEMAEAIRRTARRIEAVTILVKPLQNISTTPTQ